MVCGDYFASIFYLYKQGMALIHLLSHIGLTFFNFYFFYYLIKNLLNE